MLIAITIMVFLILWCVGMHYNDHAKVVIRLQDALEKQLEKPKFEKLYSLFEKFGFLKFYAKFEKDYIDYETLKELCELKELKELRKHIPTTGEYLKFSKKIKKHFNQDEFFDGIENE